MEKIKKNTRMPRIGKKVMHPRTKFSYILKWENMCS
jgi:hypothetical protein